MNKVYISNCNKYFEEADILMHESLKYDIIIESKINYQLNMGFGGALTDASASLIAKMSDDVKKEFINKVFNSNYLNYSLIRLTIGSCDFSNKTYDYLEDGYFNLSHDKEVIIPFLKEIKNIKQIKLFASPWSPPAIYKTNGIRQHGGKLKEESYNDYAKYLINYINEMKNNDLDISYMSLQNEPQATQIWDSCIYEPSEEARLLDLVYNEIKNSNLDTKVFIWDHNRDIIFDRVNETLNHDNYDQAYGIAYHWYDNGCSAELSKVHKEYNDKVMFFTEGCIELLILDKNNPSSNIGNFENGLRYCRNYILDSENYSNAFIDWNLILDKNGGPNYVGNYCEAPIMYDEINDKLIFNPSFYIISHFSRFIENNDIRIDTKIYKENVIATSYKKQNNSIVSVILNDNDYDINTKISIDKKGYILDIPKKSVVTLIVR